MAQIKHRQLLDPAVEAARRLLQQRIVEANGIGIWNSYKMSATLGGYPWDAMQDRTPLDPHRFPSQPWIIGGAIYAASEQIADATAQLVEGELADFVEDLQWHDAGVPDNAYLGVPSEQNVRSAYWRKKSGLPAQLDPDRDRCGLIWMCFAVPLLGQQISEVIDTIEPLMFQHGFEPNIGFNCVAGRCAHLYISLIYDREVDGEDERAVACHDEVVETLQEQGHLPYRLGLLSMSSLPRPSDQTENCLRAIKQMLDPHSILAPGRYERS